MTETHKIKGYPQKVSFNYLNKRYNGVIIKNKRGERLLYLKQSYENYRLIGLNYLEKIKKIQIPDFPKNSEFCSIFIDDRSDIFFEFIIRLFIIKLGQKCSHYVVCSENNYEFMKNICENISKNINIIKLDKNIEINTQDKYSTLLKKSSFWDNFNASKALIYQSDTYIFNEKLLTDLDFINYDYIGAPWMHKPHGLFVGNGGLSIRNIKIMKEICEIHCKHKMINNDTLPEDLFFSIYMNKLKKNIANLEQASYFSLENVHINNSDYFGGHQFWFSLHNWEMIVKNNLDELLKKYTIIT